MAERIPFRERAREVTRLEAFSDIVFGFALTLIVVALEVPRTYAEMMEDISGFAGFAACFAILIWIWHVHYTFFRRYGLTDGITILLNTILLFLVLFYVYPLKFVFSLWMGHIHDPHLTVEDIASLFTIYGLGFASIFFIYVLLYGHAYRLRAKLGLTAVEVHDTRAHLAMYSSYICIGLLSVVLANLASRRLLGLAGWSYFLLGPVSAIIGHTMGERRRRLEDAP